MRGKFRYTLASAGAEATAPQRPANHLAVYAHVLDDQQRTFGPAFFVS
jgi:hypothetical protein